MLSELKVLLLWLINPKLAVRYVIHKHRNVFERLRKNG